MTTRKRGWHFRGLTSLFTLGGFLIMSATGLILYIVPQGRIAYWIEWKFLGMTKEQWGDVHILASVLFVVAGAFHIYFNWKPLWKYLYDKASQGLKLKREIVLATILSVALVVSGILRLPPLSYLLDLNAAIKDSWIQSPDYEPPFGHAELLSFRVFCKKTNIPVGKAMEELRSADIQGVTPEKRLVDIARENGTSPRDIYRLIRKLEAQEPLLPSGSWTPERIEEQFGGTGIGNKTLRDLSARLNLTTEEISSRLEKNGLTCDLDLPLKRLSDKNATAPIEVLKAALVEPYQIKQTNR